MGTLQSRTFGLATVTASRRPSAVAESEVYCSSPNAIRRETLRATSNAQIHGPDPLRSFARNRIVPWPSGVGSRISVLSCVRRSGLPPDTDIRHRSISCRAGVP